MTRFRSILDVTREEWLGAMGLDDASVPDAVIVEGSWWRAERQAWRLGYLEDVHELDIPDVFVGTWQDRSVAFCMAYGAPRAAEVIHIFGAIGTKLAIQIGTCGGLQPHLEPGDIVVPDVVTAADGVATHYAEADTIRATQRHVERASASLRQRGHDVHVGPHITFSSLFAESSSMLARWHEEGLLSVEMETATTLAVAERFGAEAVSLLVVWDELTRGRRFLDPLPSAAATALDAANKSVFEVALELTAND